MVCITKVKEELLGPYLKSRRRANKKYYSKEENKEKKRQYMKEYAFKLRDGRVGKEINNIHYVITNYQKD